MQLDFKKPNAQEYIDLRIRAGMGQKDIKRAEIALENSLFTVSLYDEDRKLVGFGRIVGDKGITYAISDIMVDPKYQRQGYATRIMQEIDKYFSENTFEDAYILLIANSPADKLYEKFKFKYLPNNKCGMLRDQTQDAVCKE